MNKIMPEVFLGHNGEMANSTESIQTLELPCGNVIIYEDLSCFRRISKMCFQPLSILTMSGPGVETGSTIKFRLTLSLT